MTAKPMQTGAEHRNDADNAWRPPRPPSYACPYCGAVSYSPYDLAHGYCGRCHRFADDEIKVDAGGAG